MADETRDEPDERPLRGLAPAIEPPAELEEHVVAGLRARGLLGRRHGGGHGLALAASIAAAFLLGLFLRGAPASTPQGTYLLLLDAGGPLPESELAARVDEYTQWARSLAEEGSLVTAERLLPGGWRYAPGVEGAAIDPADPAPPPSGFFLLSAEDEGQARRIAASCPHVQHGGTVRLRRVAVE